MEQLNCETIEIYRSILDSVKTNMYVLPCGRDIVVLDPHPDSQVGEYLAKCNPQTIWILLTHEHPDHTLGVPWLNESFKCRLVCQRNCAERIAKEANNRPLIITMCLAEHDKKHGTHRKEAFMKSFRPYACQADEVFDSEYSLEVGTRRFDFTLAPGHSPGGCLITMDGECVFTGDNLIPNTYPILRFPESSPRDYEKITQRLLDAIPDDMLVMPGHGDPSKMRDCRL